MAARLLFTAADRAGEGADRAERDLSIAGDPGAATAARLREVVERARPAMPDGDCGRVEENRFVAGDAREGMDEAVLLLGMPVRILLRGSGVFEGGDI